MNQTVAGTELYYAPEMVLKLGYKKTLDLWTLGVFLYEMSVYDPPFATKTIKNKQALKKAIEDAEVNRDWQNSKLSNELKDLINGLLKYSPSSRLGAENWNEIKQHPFFANFDWKALENGTL